MKKRGFVLMETIVVIVVVTVSLVTIFSSYNKILTKVKSENKYDTSEYIYATQQIKKYMKRSEEITVNSIPDLLTGSVTADHEYLNKIADVDSNIKTGLVKLYGVKKIFIVRFNKGGISNINFQRFDAYMIDYLRRLDMKEDTDLIIVEYQRPVRDENYNEQKIYGTSEKLYETYIASLRW